MFGEIKEITLQECVGMDKKTVKRLNKKTAEACLMIACIGWRACMM